MTNPLVSYVTLHGHWMATIDLISSKDNGCSFVCKACVRTGGMDQEKATYRSSRSVSNMYAHFKTKHAELYSVILPLIESSKCNKRGREQSQTSIAGVLSQYKQSKFDNCLLRLFAAPDMPKAFLSDPRFLALFTAANPMLSVPTVKTLNSRLWDLFHSTLRKIKEVASDT